MNERVKQIRESHDLSMREFADKLGLTHGAISLIESGKRNITKQLVKSICSAFPDVNETWLLTGEGEMRAPASKESEIAEITALLYNEPEDSFRSKLIRLAAKMTEEQLDVLIQLVSELKE